ncbi:helix-turn-helix transcriptional regulator [Bacillus sp. SCS-151]|uniref:helix-turn-helix transcriptional regulator n=1 Tax=Nanhaiella sioensis TaxID=3115293 RepID=UPI00397CA6E2
MTTMERKVLYTITPQNKGECISVLRKKMGFTQEKLAKQLGTGRSTVVKMELGERDVSPYVWSRTVRLAYEMLGTCDVTLIEFESTLSSLLENKSVMR